MVVFTNIELNVSKLILASQSEQFLFSAPRYNPFPFYSCYRYLVKLQPTCHRWWSVDYS